jgi:hypothetical protein
VPGHWLDADLAPQPTDPLPLPDAPACAAWWQQQPARFPAGARHLRGRPFGPGELLDALGAGPMRRRPILALELALRTGGTCRIEPRTWVRDQLTRLRAARAGGTRFHAGPLSSTFIH